MSYRTVLVLRHTIPEKYQVRWTLLNYLSNVCSACHKMRLHRKFIHCRILAMGMAEGCCQKIYQKIHIDQVMDGIANHCMDLERLEVGWDMETLRFSDRSSKSIDLVRVHCPRLQCLALNDGKYFELVKSNFVRADRMTVVRTTTNCRVTNIYLISFYNDLMFN